MCEVTADPEQLIRKMVWEVEAEGVPFQLTAYLVACRESKDLRIASALADINGKHYETPPVVINTKEDKGREKKYSLYATELIGIMAGVIKTQETVPEA